MIYIANILMMWQGELQHKHSKSAYANSNKGHDKDFQIAKRAFQRHKMDAIRRANKLRGHDLQPHREDAYTQLGSEEESESSSRLPHSETLARYG